MNKTIEIKKSTIRNSLLSIIIGFSVLYGIEHFGNFSYIANNPIEYDGYGRPKIVTSIDSKTKISEISFKTYFDNQVKTAGNGFSIYDLSYVDTEFNNYQAKSYYYTQATIKDYKYGLYISLCLFLASLFFTTFKIKLS
jgi:hypothetical protein